MILKEIIANKKHEVQERKRKLSLDEIKKGLKKSNRHFKEALFEFGIIAEIKRKSPSKDAINLDVDIFRTAKIYSECAAAISVLTDEKFFGGSFKDLEKVSKASTIPVLCKDFIIDEYQIYEARRYGADAVLLIASVLSNDKIDKFLRVASELSMDCLVEVHDEEELDKVLETDAEIIGINNRNLKTFEIDIGVTLDLMKKIPIDKIIVSESGFDTREQVEMVEGYVNAILVGTSLMKSANIGKKIKELLGDD